MLVNFLSSFHQIITASFIGNINFIRKFKVRKSHENRIFDFDVEENGLFSHHESFFYSGFDKVAPVVVVRKNYKNFILIFMCICFVILAVVLLFVFKVFRNDIF